MSKGFGEYVIWENIALRRPCTHHIINIRALYCTPKTLYGVLSQLFLSHSFSTLLITRPLFLSLNRLSYYIQLLNYFSPFMQLYSVFHAAVTFLIHLHTAKAIVRTTLLQVVPLFVYATRNTGDVRNLYINSLRPIFSKPVFKTLVCYFT